MNNVVKLLTTTLSQHNYISNVYIETPKDKTRIIRIGRCVDRYISNGKYVRDCNPILNVFNNESAKILEFKR